MLLGKLIWINLVNESNSEHDEQDEPEQEIKLFQNALDFSNVKLRDCMVPRTEIVAFDEICFNRGTEVRNSLRRDYLRY